MTSPQILELTELHNFKSPEGAKVFSYKTLDGVSLRVSIWNKDSKKGSLLLQSGRTEFTEKYFEVIDEFLQRDLCVAMFDWRGQGLSDRLTKNRFIGHVNDFSEYDKEFQEILKEVYSDLCPKPWIGMGHSMGGCLLVSAEVKNPNSFDAMILCAPMLSMHISTKNEILAIIVGFLSKLGFRDKPFERPECDKIKGWIERHFEENDVTSDKKRYERSVNLLRKNEKLAVGGLTIGWVHEAVKRIRLIRRSKWLEKIKCQTLLLNATKDQLVSSTLNKKMCTKNTNIIVADIEGEHELFMEKDHIRKKAWKEVDKFLKRIL